MATFVILSSISPDAFRDPKDFPKLATSVASKIKSACPGIRWQASFALMGQYDVLDIVEADDPEEVARAAMIIRACGHSTTQIMPAMPWAGFVDMMKT